ncbi:MAG: hypothetical protein PVI57_05695 [Gemmatimonadota bacterium]
MTLAEPRDEVVAEAFVHIGRPRFGTGGDEAYVLLHRTLDASGTPNPVPGARVVILREEGGEVVLPESPNTLGCAPGIPASEGLGTCYGPIVDRGLRHGEYLRLEIELPDGGVLTSATTVPGAIDVVPDVPASLGCRLDPSQTLEVTWNRAEGAWAYVAETSIRGLEEYFDGTVDVEEPLNLLGLALSVEDTTIVFPSEFGIFDRADLEREVSVLLQEGLPDGTGADVVVAAVDRNYVNWVRGGNFNPSGQVRIPSVQGDGTGFFGSASTDALTIQVLTEAGGGFPACEGG